MNKPFRTLGLVLALGVPVVAPAADHGDSPTATANREPTADITDLYAWMSADAEQLNLVLAVAPDAQEGDAFSDAVIYQFSVSSSEGYGEPQESTIITCKFIDGTNIECWAGEEYAVGDASAPEGILSDGEGMRVFAGLRDDPFFLEYSGFQKALDDAVGAVQANAVTFEEADDGCPSLTPEQADLLVGDLTHADDGGDPANTFAGANVLALVIQIDKSIVDIGGPVLGVSASTYASN